MLKAHVLFDPPRSPLGVWIYPLPGSIITTPLIVTPLVLISVNDGTLGIVVTTGEAGVGISPSRSVPTPGGGITGEVTVDIPCTVVVIPGSVPKPAIDSIDVGIPTRESVVVPIPTGVIFAP